MLCFQFQTIRHRFLRYNATQFHIETQMGLRTLLCLCWQICMLLHCQGIRPALFLLGVVTYSAIPTKGTNIIDWSQAYTNGDNFIDSYNDAEGTDGYPISGTAGLFIVIGGFSIVLAFYGTNKGVYIGVGKRTSIANLEKVA